MAVEEQLLEEVGWETIHLRREQSVDDQDRLVELPRLLLLPWDIGLQKARILLQQEQEQLEVPLRLHRLFMLVLDLGMELIHLCSIVVELQMHNSSNNRTGMPQTLQPLVIDEVRLPKSVLDRVSLNSNLTRTIMEMPMEC